MIQIDSNDVQAARVMMEDLRKERQRTATPPPSPSVRGLCSSEKFSGVIHFSTEVGVSAVSQVSVSDMISIDWSEMNSCNTEALFRMSVIEQAECAFRQAKEREVEELAGPGLNSTSPQISNKRLMRNADL